MDWQYHDWLIRNFHDQSNVRYYAFDQWRNYQRQWLHDLATLIDRQDVNQQNLFSNTKNKSSQHENILPSSTGNLEKQRVIYRERYEGIYQNTFSIFISQECHFRIFLFSRNQLFIHRYTHSNIYRASNSEIRFSRTAIFSAWSVLLWPRLNQTRNQSKSNHFKFLRY